MQQKNCTKCGAEVVDELPGGMCPTCLMAAARQSLKKRDHSREPFDLPTMAAVSDSFPELEVLEFIGRGGMGAVYKAVQKNLDRVVALKIFLYRPNDPEFAARFEREAKALGRLNHPNIVTVHDFGSRDNMHFLTMEFVDGLNLRQLTTEEKLTPEMAIQLVPQLCDALQYAHNKGVIHRDIKPENLMIDTDGRIKIADFGLAKMTCHDDHTLTRTRQVMGTLNYMAPEQRERPTEVDHRADIYSLGVVIYELLTGELPLGRFQPPSSKTNVDAKLDEVVLRALEKEPELRYQSISEFKTGFENLGFAQPPRVTPPAPAMPNMANPAMGTPAVAHAAAGNPLPPVKSADPNLAPRGTRCMITFMSGREKKGEWTPGDNQLVFTMMGGTCLDLTQVTVPNVDLTVFTLMGGTEIIVPRGASVDLDGMILMGATENQVNYPSEPGGMKIRIRSWGAMGGCEVRSVTAKEHRGQQAMTLLQKGHVITGHPIGRGLAALYTAMAYLITMSVPLFFIAFGLGIRFTPFDGKVLGIMAALTTGLAWSCYHYFRVIVSAGPEDADDPEQVRAYSTQSKVGNLIRCVAMTSVFACPALFILASFDFGTEKYMRFAAIAAAIFGGFLFMVAEKIDESTLRNAPLD